MDRYRKYAMSNKGKMRSRRYKEKNKQKIKAQNRAIYLYPNEDLCHIKGCFNKAERHHPSYQNPEKVIWLCRKHHMEIHGKVKGKCSVCDKPQHALGFCKNHYAQKYRKEQGW